VALLESSTGPWRSIGFENQPLLQRVFKPEKSSKKELAKRDWRHIMRVLLGVTEAVIEVSEHVDF